MLQEQVQQHEIAQGFTDFEQMLDHADAIVLDSPMHLHVPQAMLDLLVRKHLLSEVTIAVLLEESWRRLEAVRLKSDMKKPVTPA